jgi:hypothetical protein
MSNLVFLVVSTTLTEDAFLNWGWRVPFLLSILLAVALYAQNRIEELAHSERRVARHPGGAPIVETHTPQTTWARRAVPYWSAY